MAAREQVLTTQISVFLKEMSFWNHDAEGIYALSVEMNCEIQYCCLGWQMMAEGASFLSDGAVKMLEDNRLVGLGAGYSDRPEEE